MKITELITKLESIKAEHGDLRVTINTDGCDLDINPNQYGEVFSIEDLSGVAREFRKYQDEEKYLAIVGYWYG